MATLDSAVSFVGDNRGTNKNEHLVSGPGRKAHKKSVLVNRDLCAVCKTAGELILCDECPRSYHEECAKQAFQELDKKHPEGAKKRQKRLAELEKSDSWTCPKCMSAPLAAQTVQSAANFSLAISREDRKVLGAGVPLERVMQYLELILPAKLFNKAFEVVHVALKAFPDPDMYPEKSRVSLQDALLLRRLNEVIGHKLLLTALKACEDNCALAQGLSTMGGPQSCLNPACASGFRKFRVLRTRCFYCGAMALDAITKLPIGFDFDEFAPTLPRKSCSFTFESDQTRYDIAARGLEYFAQVALDGKVKHNGDVLFLAYKLWSVLRHSPLETRAAKIVEQLCENYIDTIEPVFSESDDLPEILDRCEGVHVLVRILTRSETDKGQPRIKDKAKVRELVKDLQQAMKKELLRFDISDIVGFDPLTRNPPYTPSNHCSNCGEQNSKRAALCSACNHTLQKKFDYGAMTDAVVWCFVFDSANFSFTCQTNGRPCTLNAKDVLCTLPEARKYRELDELGEDFWKLECYFVTHFIYVMSDWGEVTLRREFYLEEFRFITSSLAFALQLGDTEIIGEFIHCLAILGYSPETDTATNDAIPNLKKTYEACLKFLASTEARLGEKGMWTIKSSVPYARYHAAWCGVVGLLPHKLEKRSQVTFVTDLANPEPKFCEVKYE